jgi:hypothetical protein
LRRIRKRKEDRSAVLRIDETSGTLVAPQAAGLVQESPPDREELLGLVTASWDAFAAELGLSGVRLLAREPVPYVDLLGLDEIANRLVVILVTGDTVEWQLGRALGAAADVASWDRERLLSVNAELEVVDGSVSPALVLVAGGYDPRALATIDWLASRHDVPVSAYTVAMVRFGGERLLSVRREPADESESSDPVDWLLSGGNAPPRSADDDDDGYTEASPPAHP